jgi:lysophospholipase L1-like esterase
VLQTVPMLSRRTLLIASATAAIAAACGSETKLAGREPVDPDGSAPFKPSGAKNPPKEKVPTKLAMVGDSITLGSQPALELVLADIGFTDVTINAETSRRIVVGGRKPMPGLDVVTFAAASDPPDLWVIELGTNDAGLYSTDEEYLGLVDAILAEIPDNDPLVWMSTYREDHLDGCVQFNAVLAKRLDERGNATVGGWYEQCLDTDGSILQSDGVHPDEIGRLIFADTVRQAIAARLG